MKSPILVTGAAGFIGFHLTEKLLESGQTVVGLDNMNSYYDLKLKKARLSLLQRNPSFHYVKGDICDGELIGQMFEKYTFSDVFHLAAQAGVRYSLEHPEAYIRTNLTGFFNVLNACCKSQAARLFYASSSSVYGEQKKQPFSESDAAVNPVSLYAATKRSNELMAEAYCRNHSLHAVGLRFFTVYGPYGRPDMALFSFTEAIHKGDIVSLYNHGNMKRDFTYVGDVTESVIRLWQTPDLKGHHIYNIGGGLPVGLETFISEIEKSLDKKAKKQYLPMQPGDVPITYADTAKLVETIGFKPQTPVSEGVREFVSWYLEFYSNNSL